MGLFDSKEENIKKALEKNGLGELNNLSQDEKKTIEKIISLVDFGKLQSTAIGEKSKLLSQVSLLEATTYSNLLIIKQLDQLNKNIEKLINK